MGDCRHLHANTFDFDVLVSVGKSENLLHSSQHRDMNPSWGSGDITGMCPAHTGDPGQSCCRAGTVAGHTCG